MSTATVARRALSLSAVASGPVKLNYFTVGSATSAPPLLLLHGLLGSGNNFRTLCAALHKETARQVFALDLRNHGRSPHSPIMTYESMCSDLDHFAHQHGLHQFALLGHSLGGKVSVCVAAVFKPQVAMAYAVHNPTVVRDLCVVDIAPMAYSSPSDSMGEVATVIKALHDLPLATTLSR
jgi:pimeloyl-ACP methyl ester carboxylesterase